MNTTHSVAAFKATSAEIPFALANFPKIPDDALVNIDVVIRLFGCAKSSAWAWVAAGKLPAPKHFGRSARWRVGDLRKALVGEVEHAPA